MNKDHLAIIRRGSKRFVSRKSLCKRKVQSCTCTHFVRQILPARKNSRCFLLCQRFRKFLSDFKWKGPFWFLLTGIFGITSGGGPYTSVGIIRPKFAIPFLTNRFFALVREYRKKNLSDNSDFYLLVRFKRKISFQFPQVFPLISDRSVWHNGKYPRSPEDDSKTDHT